VPCKNPVYSVTAEPKVGMAESRVQMSAVQEPRLLCHGRTQGWNGRIQGAHECRARSQSTTAVIASRCCVMLFGSLAIESISARRKAWSLRAVSKVARLRSFVCDCSTSAPAVLSVSGRVHGQNPAVLRLQYFSTCSVAI
jgi:hypothetical protein